MAESTSASIPPKEILLATDLSCRGDRALDRSVQLAREWKAQLLIVHAIEKNPEEAMLSRREWDVPSWRRPRDPTLAVRDELNRDMADQHDDVEIDIHVEEGEAGEVILEERERRASDLIIAGVSRRDPEAWIGSTLRWLARKSPVPLLIVRERALAPYRKLVVATDFSASSRRALETAVGFFPKAELSIFHGYDLPFAGYLGRDELSQQFDELGGAAFDKFLGEADIPADMLPRIGKLIEHGVPERLLSDYSRKFDRHLTVVGSHGGGAIYDILIGSTARKIIEAVPGDVLLVPEPKARKARS